MAANWICKARRHQGDKNAECWSGCSHRPKAKCEHNFILARSDVDRAPAPARRWQVMVRNRRCTANCSRSRTAAGKEDGLVPNSGETGRRWSDAAASCGSTNPTCAAKPGAVGRHAPDPATWCDVGAADCRNVPGWAALPRLGGTASMIGSFPDAAFRLI